MVKEYLLPNKTYDILSLDETICMICRELAYPPVTLPCDHLFCKQCYDIVKERADFLCPNCRKRFAIWDRKRKNEVIDVNLQQAILKHFPEKVELKISGEDDGVAKEIQEKTLAESRRIAQPGEVKKEYLLALEEDILEREQEQIASEKCIEEIQKEQEKIANELKKREEEDAAVAQAILQQEEEECRKLREEKEKLEILDKQLALNIMKELGESRVLPPTPRIVQRSLDTYIDSRRTVTPDVAPASGSSNEEQVSAPSVGIETEPEESWTEIDYVREQIEKDHLLALQIHNKIEMELINEEKKRKLVSDYSLRSAAKKKKPGKTSPKKQIKLDTMGCFKPRRLSFNL